MESSMFEWQNTPHRCITVRLGSSLRDFYQALEDFDNAPEARVAIVVSEEGATARDGEVIPRERYRPRKPVIMALRGLQSGSSLGALLSISGMRVASSNASFGSADIRSHDPAPGMLPYAVWSALFMTHSLLTAHTALGWNIINEVIEDPLLETRAFELAARLTEILPRAPVLGKEAQALSEFINGNPLIAYGFGAYVLCAHHVFPYEETQAVARRRRPKLRSSNNAG
jgi:enoyl-CoA hydratase/carnithine racemase